MNTGERQTPSSKEKRDQGPECHHCGQSQDSSSKLRKYVSCTQEDCANKFCRDCCLRVYHYSHNKISSLQTKNSWKCFSCMGSCKCLNKCTERPMSDVKVDFENPQQERRGPPYSEETTISKVEENKRDQQHNPRDTADEGALASQSRESDASMESGNDLSSINSDYDVEARSEGSNNQENIKKQPSQKSGDCQSLASKNSSTKFYPRPQKLWKKGGLTPTQTSSIDNLRQSALNGIQQEPQTSRDKRAPKMDLHSQNFSNSVEREVLSENSRSCQANALALQGISHQHQPSSYKDTCLPAKNPDSNSNPTSSAGNQCSKTFKKYEVRSHARSSIFFQGNANVVINFNSEEGVAKEPSSLLKLLEDDEDVKVENEREKNNASRDRKAGNADFQDGIHHSQKSSCSDYNKQGCTSINTSPALKKKRQRTSLLTQLQESSGLPQDILSKGDTGRRSRRENIKRPDHFQQAYCHHCGHLEVIDNLITCRNEICQLQFCFVCLQHKYMSGNLRSKQDFMNLKKTGMACPVCNQRCKCKKCAKANIIDDISKIRKDLNSQGQPPMKEQINNQTDAASKMETSEVPQEAGSTKIQICTQGLNSGFASSLSSFKKDKQAQGLKNSEASLLNNLRNKKGDPNYKMFQTTKIGASVGNNAKQQFKYDQPQNPYQGFKHNFSEAKFFNVQRPDYNGYPPDVDDQYTEEIFDYNKIRLELALDRVEDITRDKVSFRDSLRTLEVTAVKSMVQESRINIDGFEICEQPEVSLNNYSQNFAFHQLKKRIDAISPIASFEHSQSLVDSSSLKEAIARRAKVMEFGMNTNLIGTKRTYENASQQKITPKVDGSQVDGSEESTKRRKLVEDETLKNNENSVSIKIMLPNNEQKDSISKKEDTGSKMNSDSQSSNSELKDQEETKQPLSEKATKQRPIFSVTTPKSLSKHSTSMQPQVTQRDYHLENQRSSQAIQPASVPSNVLIDGKVPISKVASVSDHALLKTAKDKISLVQQQSHFANGENEMQIQNPGQIFPPDESYAQHEMLQAPTGYQPQVMYYYQTPYGFAQAPQGHADQMFQSPYTQSMYPPQAIQGGYPCEQSMVAQGQYPQYGSYSGQQQVIVTGGSGQQTSQQHMVQQNPQCNQQVYGYIQGPNGQQTATSVPVQAIHNPVGQAGQPAQPQYQLIQTSQGPIYVPTQSSYSPYQSQSALGNQQNQTQLQTPSGQTLIYAAHPQQPSQPVQPQYQLATTSTGQQVLIVPQTAQAMTPASTGMYEASYYPQGQAIQYQGLPGQTSLYGRNPNDIQIAQAQGQPPLEGEVIPQRHQPGCQNYSMAEEQQQAATQAFLAGNKGQGYTMAYYDPQTQQYYPVQSQAQIPQIYQEGMETPHAPQIAPQQYQLSRGNTVQQHPEAQMSSYYQMEYPQQQLAYQQPFNDHQGYSQQPCTTGRDHQNQSNHTDVCINCHKAKTNPPQHQVANRQSSKQSRVGQSGNGSRQANVANKNEASYPGNAYSCYQTPQIIYQPFQVIRGNLYQTSLAPASQGNLDNTTGQAQQQTQKSRGMEYHDVYSQQIQAEDYPYHQGAAQNQSSINRAHLAIPNGGDDYIYSNEASLVGNRQQQVQGQSRPSAQSVHAPRELSQQNDLKRQQQILSQNHSPQQRVPNQSLMMAKQQQQQQALVMSATPNNEDEYKDNQLMNHRRNPQLSQPCRAQLIYSETIPQNDHQSHPVEQEKNFKPPKSILTDNNTLIQPQKQTSVQQTKDENKTTEVLNPMEILMKHGLKNEQEITDLMSGKYTENNKKYNQEFMQNIDMIFLGSDHQNDGNLVGSQQQMPTTNDGGNFEQVQRASQDNKGQQPISNNQQTRHYRQEEGQEQAFCQSNQAFPETQNVYKSQQIQGSRYQDQAQQLQMNNQFMTNYCHDGQGQVQQEADEVVEGQSNDELNKTLANLSGAFNQLYHSQRQHHKNLSRQNESVMHHLGGVGHSFMHGKNDEQ